MNLPLPARLLPILAALLAASSDLARGADTPATAAATVTNNPAPPVAPGGRRGGGFGTSPATIADHQEDDGFARHRLDPAWTGRKQ